MIQGRVDPGDESTCPATITMGSSYPGSLMTGAGAAVVDGWLGLDPAGV